MCIFSCSLDRSCFFRRTDRRRQEQVMRRESKVMRGDGDTVFAQVKKGVGVDEIKALILAAYEATKPA